MADLLSAIVRQFRQHISATDAELAKYATIFVREVRYECIKLELVPYIMVLYQSVDMAVTIDAFVARIKDAISTFSSGLGIPDAKKSDLSSFHDVVKAIAKDENGSLHLESAEFHKTKSTSRSSFRFDTNVARPALKTIERQKLTLDLPAHEVFENVLLVFWQSNVAESLPGKKTSEKAIVESVSDRPLAVIYATESARNRIKSETTGGDRNIYKLGFFVDCYVERLQGRPVAYKITTVRDIIDLPEDEESK